MARRDEYAEDLDDLVLPPQPNMRQNDWMRQYEADIARMKAEEAKRDEARMQKSREFSISPEAAQGGDPAAKDGDPEED
jgi:hypothetical protein